MDDLNLVEDTPQAQRRQATLKEMARRAQDRILVFNPTLEDYTVRFDGIGFVVPNRNKDNGHGMGRAVVLRYVATNYLTQMIDLILGTRMEEAIRLENERRVKAGMMKMSKYVGGEELQFATSLRTDNQERRRELVPVIWLGLAERYGDDTKEASASGKPKDDRPMDERLLAEIEYNAIDNSTKVSEAPEMPQNRATEPTEEHDIAHLTYDDYEKQDLSTKDVFTLRKIAKERGLETAKTDKKDELIAKISQ